MADPLDVPPNDGSGRPPQPDEPPSNDVDHNVLLCERVGESLTPASGSEVRPCHRCGALLIVSPAGLAFSAENPVELICIDCGLQDDWEGEKAHPVPGTPSELTHLVITKHGLANLMDVIAAWRRGRRN